MTIEAFAAHLQRVAEKRLAPVITRTLSHGVLAAEGEAKGLASTRMHRRNSYLYRSIIGTVDGEWPVLTSRLVAGGGDKEVRYAAIQEYGGTVFPKKGKFLAIPVGPALTDSGRAKYASPRMVPNLRFVSILGGAKGLLVQTTGKRNARSTIWFVLVRKVTIREKRYMRDPWDRYVATIGDQLNTAVTATLADM